MIISLIYNVFIFANVSFAWFKLSMPTTKPLILECAEINERDSLIFKFSLFSKILYAIKLHFVFFIAFFVSLIFGNE